MHEHIDGELLKPPEHRQAEALRMLDLFESVGARSFHLTFTNLQGDLTGHRKQQPITEVRRSFRSTLLASCAARGTNIMLRPLRMAGAPRLVQLDDLDSAALEKVRPAAFMTLATSPGNHQAWVAVENGTDDTARRLKKGDGIGADDAASDCTRISGHPNFKPKYAPHYPTVTILDAQPGRIVTAQQLNAMGLLAAPAPARPAPTLRVSSPARTSNRTWPSYARALQGAPPTRGGDRSDISKVDFHWCMVCASWNFGIEEIADKLMELSTKARQNGYDYAILTARNATAAHERQPRERA